MGFRCVNVWPCHWGNQLLLAPHCRRLECDVYSGAISKHVEFYHSVVAQIDLKVYNHHDFSRIVCWLNVKVYLDICGHPFTHHFGIEILMPFQSVRDKICIHKANDTSNHLNVWLTQYSNSRFSNGCVSSHWLCHWVYSYSWQSWWISLMIPG